MAEKPLGAADLLRLAEEHGTPLHVQDLSSVRARYRRLRAALPEVVEIFYAVKANPHPRIVEALVAEGAGLEVASSGELALAESFGLPAGRVAFAGPAKRRAELERALELGLVLNVESEGELLRADAIAGHLGVSRDVCVRVNPPWGVEEEHAILGGGRPTQFGVDLDLLPAFLATARACRNVTLSGLHVFCATNVLDADVLAENAGRILDLALDLERDGVPVATVDLGGGLGVPYETGRAELDVERYGRRLDRALAARFSGGLPRVITEPGRYLVAFGGTFLTRVVDRKTCRGRTFVTCDGGINCLLRPALIGQAHPTFVVGRDRDEPDGRYDVAGPLCTSLDVLAKDVPLPDPRPGDLIAIGRAGAYGYTESMVLFLSHRLPEQVVVAADGPD